MTELDHQRGRRKIEGKPILINFKKKNQIEVKRDGAIHSQHIFAATLGNEVI
jgi:hypothetical protein